MLDFRLLTLGTFALRVGEKDAPAPSTQKARALLAYLALHRGRRVGREGLLETFWPEADPERARHNLKTAIWSIRRAIRLAGEDPDDFLDGDRSSIGWVAAGSVDAAEFLELARMQDSSAAQRALALHNGPFLDGQYDDWVVAMRERIDNAYEEILQQLVASNGDADAARALLERNPYREEAYAVLIDREIAEGRPIAARALVDRARAAFHDLKGTVSPEFERRYGKIEISASTAAWPQLPFVGRDREMAEIAALLREPGTAQRTILLCGQAGIGKSKLLAHVRRLARESHVTSVDVQASDTDVRTFGPWEELFTDLAGVSIEAFAAAGDREVAQRLAAELAAALPARTLLIVDDAHALRGDALAVLRELAPRARARSAVVLCAVRPEGRGMIAQALANEPLREMTLQPIAPEELGNGLRQIFGAGSEAVAEQFYERSAGHPLFVNDLLYTLWREGAVVRRHSVWKLAWAANRKLPLPDDLASAVELRLATRGEDPKKIACALALDPQADVETLCAAVRLPPERVLDAIDDLLALDLIRQGAEGATFVFSHDFIREVAARAMHGGHRRRLHAAFAQLLEQKADRESLVRRARHLAGAGEAALAAQAYADAAAAALEWFAWNNALEYCRAGIVLVKDLEGTARGDEQLAGLKGLVARAHMIAGSDDAAVAPAEHAVTHARASGSARLLAETSNVAARAFLNCHAIERAVAAAEEALDAGAGSESDTFRAQAAIVLASAHCHDGDRDGALRAARAALEAAERSLDPAGIASAADALVRAQITWLLYADAVEVARIGAEAARRAGWLADGAFRVTQGALAHYLGRCEDALRSYDDALRIVDDDSGERRWQITLAGVDRLKVRFFARYLKGVALAALERWDEAIAAASPLLQERLSQSSFMVRNNVLHLYADALLGREAPGDAVLAEQFARQLVEDRYEQGSILDFSAAVALTRARVAARLRRPESAALLADALVAVENHALRTPLESDVAYGHLARAAAEIGDETVARLALRRQSACLTERRAARETAVLTVR